jgi:hypothetical protein
VGLLFAFVWTLIARPFGAELAAKRLTRFSWRDIVGLTEPANLAEHRHLGVQMLDRLMQHLPRLAMTGQDTGIALREVRVALNLLDLLAYAPRSGVPNALLRKWWPRSANTSRRASRLARRLPAPSPLLMTMDRARRALTARRRRNPLNLLHALSGLRLALLPGVEFVGTAELEEPLPDGAPL